MNKFGFDETIRAVVSLVLVVGFATCNTGFTYHMSYKLFIPGPIAVSEKTLRAMAQPMIGHRSTDFVALYQSLTPQLQSLFYTKDPVYLSTSSAWGVMEGSLRNVVKKKVLCCMNGAFSDKWL